MAVHAGAVPHALHGLDTPRTGFTTGLRHPGPRPTTRSSIATDSGGGWRRPASPRCPRWLGSRFNTRSSTPGGTGRDAGADPCPRGPRAGVLAERPLARTEAAPPRRSTPGVRTRGAGGARSRTDTLVVARRPARRGRDHRAEASAAGCAPAPAAAEGPYRERAAGARRIHAHGGARAVPRPGATLIRAPSGPRIRADVNRTLVGLARGITTTLAGASHS
jgi:hypothetical protein